MTAIICESCQSADAVVNYSGQWLYSSCWLAICADEDAEILADAPKHIEDVKE